MHNHCAAHLGQGDGHDRDVSWDDREYFAECGDYRHDDSGVAGRSPRNFSFFPGLRSSRKVDDDDDDDDDFLIFMMRSMMMMETCGSSVCCDRRQNPTDSMYLRKCAVDIGNVPDLYSCCQMWVCLPHLIISNVSAAIMMGRMCAIKTAGLTLGHRQLLLQLLRRFQHCDTLPRQCHFFFPWTCVAR